VSPDALPGFTVPGDGSMPMDMDPDMDMPMG
jgi:hypothetical protein